MENVIIIIVAAIPLSLFLFRWSKYHSRRLSLPPGPKGVPILGNIFDVPDSMPWKGFQELSRVYGDVLHLKIPTQSIVVLGSAQAAFDLLDKRSDIYSSRPHKLMLDLISPRPWNLVVMKYGLRWRNYRRQFHQYFHQHTVCDYRPIQVQQCRAFLRRALDDPNNLSHHIRLIYSAIILKIVYGMDVTNMHDEYIQLAETAISALSQVQVPGKFWIEFLPILRWVPKWFPGAHFKRWAAMQAPIINEMVDKPFDSVMKNIASGKAGESVVVTMIENMSVDSDEKLSQNEREEVARGVAGIAYGAAADTTAGAAQSFFIAMSLYPDVQRKAQQELDNVVGRNRLPDFDDYDNLVYIQAIVLECMRWMPATPIGVPHTVIRDDEYKGFFIPKDAMIVANQWAMLRDPEDYPEPDRFRPERFIKDGKLNNDVRDPTSISFGFGRRICPGRWLSSGSLFMTVASVLHTLDIHAIVGPDGKRYDPSNHIMEGTNLLIDKVPCFVTPRSEIAKKLIREWTFSP
ncbi:hypothetical protein QCA50_008858 [Cerrena zonata]|uniref:Cytochrome P450 n=1 Tax=Cerrena zonata TaxID=2478898 RepID=A0AAW0G2S7_9APHY